ncbi:MAG TPA: hypothetical protein VGF60_21465 [Xanthobacteraceae bacterium]|jgi:hypothetical protein
MIVSIDLDSWEAGYADGQFGHALECPGHLDKFSYSSGYYEGRASQATCGNQPVRRRAQSRRHPIRVR